MPMRIRRSRSRLQVRLEESEQEILKFNLRVSSLSGESWRVMEDRMDSRFLGNDESS